MSKCWGYYHKNQQDIQGKKPNYFCKIFFKNIFETYWFLIDYKLPQNLYPIILISLRLFFPRRSFIRKVGLLFLEHKKGTLPLGSAPTT